VSSQLDYYTFMGFNPEELRQRYAVYADRFKSGTRVLDVGCGRGEFLELLAARGIDGIGLDADTAMVQEVERKGLKAVTGEAVRYLEGHPGEFDGIFAAHLVEHLRPEGVDDLVRTAVSALKANGQLLIVTPNPHNLQMQLNDFWIDLQHIRFYSPDILRWILHRAGLREIQVGENPAYRSGPTLTQRVLNLSTTSPGSRTVVRRVRDRAGKLLGLGAAWRRIAELEAHTNALYEWMRGLYPAAEYFVTGVK
jgi:SAM-dependent methyltransferase